MHFRLKITGVVFCLLLASQFGFGATKRRKAVQPPPPPPPVQQAPPGPPPPSPTPEEMPAAPPRVSMDNGMLSISAENSTLGDILSAVHRQTGASLDVPPSLSGERVATQLGPGSPRDVVQQLFAGSKFDYIIVGSPQDPNVLQRIIVTARGAGGGSGPAMANNQPTQSSSQPPADASDAMDEEPQPEPQPEPASPEQQPVTPPTGAQPNSNQPKTPEQLLQELQQMQRQGPQRNPQGAPQQNPPQPQ
jgi:hypothetical protein